MDLFWEIKRAILAQFLLHGRTDLAGEAWKEILQKSLLSEHPTNERTNERDRKRKENDLQAVWPDLTKFRQFIKN